MKGLVLLFNVFIPVDGWRLATGADPQTTLNQEHTKTVNKLGGKFNVVESREGRYRGTKRARRNSDGTWKQPVDAKINPRASAILNSIWPGEERIAPLINAILAPARDNF